MLLIRDTVEIGIKINLTLKQVFLTTLLSRKIAGDQFVNTTYFGVYNMHYTETENNQCIAKNKLLTTDHLPSEVIKSLKPASPNT
jgi:hypothetical protein